MKLYDSIKYSWIKSTRDKRNKRTIILLIFCILAIEVILSMNYNFNSFINESLNNNYGFRTLDVSPLLDEEDLGLSIIKSIPHVIDAYDSFYDTVYIDTDLKNDDYDGYLKFTYGGYLDYIAKYDLENTDEKVAICPSNFYPTSEASSLNIDKDKIIDTSKIIGKEFKVIYQSKAINGSQEEEKEYEETYKIIGEYDNKIDFSFNNQCYVSLNNIKEILNNKYPNQSSIFNFFVVVDSLENVEEVINNLNEYGLETIGFKNGIDSDIVSNIMKIKNITITIVIAALLILLYLNIKKKISKENEIIGIYKAFGYKYKDFLKIYINEMFFLSTFSYLIAMIIYFILFLLTKYLLLNNFTYVGIILNVDFSSMASTYIIQLLISLFVIYIIIGKRINQQINFIVGDN